MINLIVQQGIQSLFDVPDEYFMVKFLNSDRDKYRGKVIYPSAFQDV